MKVDKKLIRRLIKEALDALDIKELQAAARAQDGSFKKLKRTLQRKYHPDTVQDELEKAEKTDDFQLLGSIANMLEENPDADISVFLANNSTQQQQPKQQRQQHRRNKKSPRLANQFKTFNNIMMQEEPRYREAFMSLIDSLYSIYPMATFIQRDFKYMIFYVSNRMATDESRYKNFIGYLSNIFRLLYDANNDPGVPHELLDKSFEYFKNKGPKGMSLGAKEQNRLIDLNKELNFQKRRA